MKLLFLALLFILTISGAYSAPARYSSGSSGSGSHSSGRQPPRYSSVVQNAQAGPSNQQYNPNRLEYDDEARKYILGFRRPPSPAVPNPEYDPVLVRRPNEISRPMKLQGFRRPSPARKQSIWKSAKSFLKKAVGKVMKQKPKANSRF